MERNLSTQLSAWYKKKGRKPVLLRGARQVGKSTLVKNFCKAHQLVLIEVNLEKSPLKALELEGFQIAKIIQEIELTYQHSLTAPGVLLFFDEIQSQPKAITALRYFYEDYPHISVLAAGSLLELALAENHVSFPVGRIENFFLGPMTFSEFVRAAGNTRLTESLTIGKLETISETAFQMLKDLYLHYLVVGGMPEAVDKFFRTKDLEQVQKVHKSIVETYKSDFPKYAKRINVSRLEMVFENVPAIVGEKLKFSKLNPEMKSRDLKNILSLLSLARIVSPCTHSNASGVPLSAHADSAVQKLYFLDVGLYNYMMQTPRLALLQNEELANRGAIAEQFVAQHLLYHQETQRPLHYWLRDKSTGKAEVDFLLQHENKILPIEVKATSAKKLKSLLVFLFEKDLKLGFKLSLEKFKKEKLKEKLSDGMKAKTVETKIITLPLFFIERIYETL